MYMQGQARGYDTSLVHGKITFNLNISKNIKNMTEILLHWKLFSWSETCLCMPPCLRVKAFGKEVCTNSIFRAEKYSLFVISIKCLCPLCFCIIGKTMSNSNVHIFHFVLREFISVHPLWKSPTMSNWKLSNTSISFSLSLVYVIAKIAMELMFLAVH